MAKGVSLSHLSTPKELEEAHNLLTKALTLFRQLDDVRGVSACLLKIAGTFFCIPTLSAF